MRLRQMPWHAGSRMYAFLLHHHHLVLLCHELGWCSQSGTRGTARERRETANTDQKKKDSEHMIKGMPREGLEKAKGASSTPCQWPRRIKRKESRRRRSMRARSSLATRPHCPATLSPPLVVSRGMMHLCWHVRRAPHRTRRRRRCGGGVRGVGWW